MSPIWLYKGYVDSYHFPRPLLCYDNCNRVQIYNLSAEQRLSKEGDDRTRLATPTANNYRTGSAGTKHLDSENDDKCTESSSI
jgi:hypothetical protein